MSRINIGLLTRHSYDEKETDELIEFLKEKGMIKDSDYTHMIKQRLYWDATTDAESDNKANKERWKKITDEFDIVIGVFPVVALATRPEGLRLFSSIPGGPVGATRHVRWEEI